MSNTHGHSHSHGLDPQAGRANRARLLITIGIVSLVLVVEVIGGVFSGSLALFADAGHMLSDLTGLLVALVALSVAARPATDAQTFGHRRAEVFGALANGLILLVVVAFVVVEAVTRLLDPAVGEVQAPLMLLVASLGAVANTAGLGIQSVRVAVPVCVAHRTSLETNAEQGPRRDQTGKTSSVLLAVAMSLPLESCTVPSAKAARLPGFVTMPTAVNWPVSAITGRR